MNVEKENTTFSEEQHSADAKSDESPSYGGAPVSDLSIGPPWFYKKYFGKIYYASPAVQLVIISFVCFLCPGMFNAVNAIGAGGQVNPKVQDKANSALYSTFSVLGFFAGSIVNKAGIRSTLAVSGLGYVLYIGSFLSYNHDQNSGFVIAAGAILGVCAGLLWAAQGAIMLSYPTEENKGKYISWFWMIFNLGAVIGSLIPLGENINNGGGTVSDGTYAGFIVLMFVGSLLALTLCSAKHVIREDGSRVIVMKHPTWKSEFLGMWEVLFTDWYIVLLFPMFFASNFFYTYQFNVVNLFSFTLRTRSLNSVLYYISQIIGAYVFGYGLDYKGVSRKTRAKVGFGLLFVLTFVIWGGGYAFQKASPFPERPDASVDLKTLEPFKIDWTDGRGYIGPMFLFMFYGFFDAAWQTTAYWFMGSLSNNSRKLANFAGFYKGIQSAGAAVAYGYDASSPSFFGEFAANWGLLAGGLVVAMPAILYRVTETTLLEDDLKFSDETAEEVKATGQTPIVMATEAREAAAGPA